MHALLMPRKPTNYFCGKSTGGKLFGRQINEPRLSCWIGDPKTTYSYSGIEHHPAPWTRTVRDLKHAAENVLPGVTFNSVLANLYRSGADSMGWHSDDEPELGPRPVIASFSFGATRDMRFRHRRDKKRSYSLSLVSGSLLVMSGNCQRQFQHSIPKRTGVAHGRINLTFRHIVQ